jgi:uncharacterized membrane protein YcaP (DUF421 family)
MFGLCKYKTIFGIPKQGVHQYRLFDIAIADVLATVVISALFGYIMKWNIPFTIFTAFVLGIIMHRIFCVRTTLDKLIFPTA